MVCTRARQLSARRLRLGSGARRSHCGDGCALWPAATGNAAGHEDSGSQVSAGAATVIDLAAYLGVTTARVRQIIAQHGIKPVGTRWKAKLYEPREVIRLSTSSAKRQD